MPARAKARARGDRAKARVRPAKDQMCVVGAMRPGTSRLTERSLQRGKSRNPTPLPCSCGEAIGRLKRSHALESSHHALTSRDKMSGDTNSVCRSSDLPRLPEYKARVVSGSRSDSQQWKIRDCIVETAMSQLKTSSKIFAN